MLLSFTLFKEDIAFAFVVGFLVSQGQRIGPDLRPQHQAVPRREERVQPAASSSGAK